MIDTDLDWTALSMLCYTYLSGQRWILDVFDCLILLYSDYWQKFHGNVNYEWKFYVCCHINFPLNRILMIFPERVNYDWYRRWLNGIINVVLYLLIRTNFEFYLFMIFWYCYTVILVLNFMESLILNQNSIYVVISIFHLIKLQWFFLQG